MKTFSPDPDETLPPKPVSARALLIGQQRLAALNRYGSALAEGKKAPEACRIAEASASSISRWSTALGKQGLPGLVPRFANCGRKSKLLEWHVSPAVVSAVASLARQRNCGVTAAWRQYGQMVDCPPTLAPRLAKSIPPSLVRAVQKALAESPTGQDDLATAVAAYEKQAGLTAQNYRLLPARASLARRIAALEADLTWWRHHAQETERILESAISRANRLVESHP